jgi:hypothetical protein
MSGHVASSSDLQAKADAIGLPGTLASILASCREIPEFKTYRVLAQQIEDAQAAVTAAHRTFERVTAAKRLLEDSPEPNLANKLRTITGEIEQAEKDKASAEADLAQIKRLLPGHWAQAAGRVLSQASAAATKKLGDLLNAEQTAKKKVEHACEVVSGILQKAILEHIVPLADEIAVLEVASAQPIEKGGANVEKILQQLMGRMPASLVRVRDEFVPKPEEPKPVEQPPQPRANPRVARAW